MSAGLRESMYRTFEMLRAVEEGVPCVGCGVDNTEAHDEECWLDGAIVALDFAIMTLDEQRTNPHARPAE